MAGRTEGRTRMMVVKHCHSSVLSFSLMLVNSSVLLQSSSFIFTCPDYAVRYPGGRPTRCLPSSSLGMSRLARVTQLSFVIDILNCCLFCTEQYLLLLSWLLIHSFSLHSSLYILLRLLSTLEWGAQFVNTKSCQTKKTFHQFLSCCITLPSLETLFWESREIFLLIWSFKLGTEPHSWLQG